MSTLDLTPILKSPRLQDIAATLNDRLRTESLARQRFYDEMSDESKVEFIDGEIILHSPVQTASSRELQSPLVTRDVRQTTQLNQQTLKGLFTGVP